MEQTSLLNPTMRFTNMAKNGVLKIKGEIPRIVLNSRKGESNCWCGQSHPKALSFSLVLWGGSGEGEPQTIRLSSSFVLPGSFR